MAMLGSVPAASASEDTSDLDVLCMATGWVYEGSTSIGDLVSYVYAYITVERDYAEALALHDKQVCSGFTSQWIADSDGSQSFNYTFVDLCDEDAIDIPNSSADTHADLCSMTEFVIDSTGIGGGCVDSANLVHLCARYDVYAENFHYLPSST